MPKQTTLAGHNGRDHAWAIELRYVPGFLSVFAGAYNFVGHLDGCQQGQTTALFATRAAARAARKELWGWGQGHAVVRKVRCHIEILKERP